MRQMTMGVVVAIACILASCGTENLEAHNAVQRYKQAAISQSADQLRGISSKELRRAAAQLSDEEVVRQFEPQRQGMIRWFGQAELERYDFSVVGVDEDTYGIVTISVEWRGETLSKPLFFVREDGELKFAGALRPVRGAATAVAGVNGNWPNWKMRFNGQSGLPLDPGSCTAFPRAFVCGDAPVFTVHSFVGEGTLNSQTCFGHTCTWYGSTCTAVCGSNSGMSSNTACSRPNIDILNGAPGQFYDRQNCAYQVIGNDMWFEPDPVACGGLGKWDCFQL